MVASSRGRRRLALALVAMLAPAALAACNEKPTYAYPDKRGGETQPTWSNQKRDTVFGEGGLSLFGGDKKKAAEDAGGGIGVNAFLWRASLDTIGFMPITSADAFGGVIITDWFSPPESPSERFKVTVFIMDRALRADGVRVSVFRQNRDRAGNWIYAPVEAKTGTEMEDAILTRARQLRISAAGTDQ